MEGLRSDRGVEQVSCGRAGLSLGPGDHRSSGRRRSLSKFSLSDASLFTCCLVSHLLRVLHGVGNMAALTFGASQPVAPTI